LHIGARRWRSALKVAWCSPKASIPTVSPGLYRAVCCVVARLAYRDLWRPYERHFPHWWD
jgi:hypothetical protein